MHFFLTGARQAGKSTAIAKALAGTGIVPGGFVTVFARDAEPRTLLLLPPDAPRTFDACRVVARFADGRMRADADRFDSLGTECLRNAERAPLILMDECGFLESDALRFRRAVLSALDGEVPVLGVVREGAGGWTERIRAHPKVMLRTLTPENRDEIADSVLQWLKREVLHENDG